MSATEGDISKLIGMQITGDREIAKLALEISNGNLDEAVNFIISQQDNKEVLNARKKKKFRIPRKKMESPSLHDSSRPTHSSPAGNSSRSCISIATPSPSPRKSPGALVKEVQKVTGCRNGPLIHRLLLMHGHEINRVCDMLFEKSEEALQKEASTWKGIEEKRKRVREERLKRDQKERDGIEKQNCRDEKRECVVRERWEVLSGESGLVHRFRKTPKMSACFSDF
mmetsp:Transcript_10442/g.14486  ORF Transcript_10442/g.14486 Transcript_10442/m.14486 type:complete len:226 (-) Transcript_10442:196-873(-)